MRLICGPSVTGHASTFNYTRYSDQCHILRPFLDNQLLRLSCSSGNMAVSHSSCSLTLTEDLEDLQVVPSHVKFLSQS